MKKIVHLFDGMGRIYRVNDLVIYGYNSSRQELHIVLEIRDSGFLRTVCSRSISSRPICTFIRIPYAGLIVNELKDSESLKARLLPLIQLVGHPIGDCNYQFKINPQSSQNETQENFD